MSTKSFIWFGMFVGSAVGAYVPALWGASVFSFSSVVFSALGAMAGLWLGYRMSIF